MNLKIGNTLPTQKFSLLGLMIVFTLGQPCSLRGKEQCYPGAHSPGFVASKKDIFGNVHYIVIFSP